MLLVIDNYDSFTYNLVQYLGELGEELLVKRNDAVTAREVARLKPTGLVISPGPGRPEESGACPELIMGLGPRVPLLGVCLGHQALASALGGRVTRTKRLMHGKLSGLRHDGRGVFHGLPGALRVVRYHSLAVERRGLPSELEVSAESDDGVVMGLRHRRWPAHGVQFHPESFQTESGSEMLKNFLRMKG